jgi:hypothetical protein
MTSPIQILPNSSVILPLNTVWSGKLKRHKIKISYVELPGVSYPSEQGVLMHGARTKSSSVIELRRLLWLHMEELLLLRTTKRESSGYASSYQGRATVPAACASVEA